MTDEVKEYVRGIASKGGRARARKLTAEERSAIARAGGRAGLGIKRPHKKQLGAAEVADALVDGLSGRKSRKGS